MPRESVTAKPPDRACAKLVEHGRGDDCGQVRVRNGNRGAVKARLHRRKRREAIAQFFPYAP